MVIGRLTNVHVLHRLRGIAVCQVKSAIFVIHQSYLTSPLKETSAELHDHVSFTRIDNWADADADAAKAMTW